MADTLYLLYALRDAIEFKEKVRTIQAKEALNKLTQYMFNKNELKFPNNIPELYSFLLNEPCCNYLDGISSKDPFSNIDGEINREINEYLEEDNPDEKIQADIMKTILMLCRDEARKIIDEETEEELKIRKNYWENVYREARCYIGAMSIRNKVKLDVEANKFPSKVCSLIKKGYISDRRVNERQILCPVCGERALGNNSNLCRNEVCNYYIKKNNLQTVCSTENGKNVRLAPGLYKFVLSPGIGEKNIYEKIKQRFPAYETIFYPNIDEYDIDVRSGDKVIHIDVKDARTPEVLVRKLMEESNLDKMIIRKDRTVWLVIPDHRISIYHKDNNGDYISKLKQLLRNEKLNIEVINEYHLFSIIEQEMEDLF